jgi:dienelactone hydrolase
MVTLFSRLLYVLVALNCLSIAAADPQISIVTVFYQGMNNTQPLQAARLTGPKGFDYPYTKEHVSNPRALDCIINYMPHPEIAEVELFNPSTTLLGYLDRPDALCWFAFTRISRWYNTTRVEPIIDGANQDTDNNKSLCAHMVRVNQINLGQEQDLAEHKKRIEACKKAYPESGIVLYGVSRGALTTATAYAQEQYEGVKAVVLEGCPSSIPDVINTNHGALILGLYEKYIQRICAHDPEGISALACIEKFPKRTPVLFITSDKDKVVPSACTKRLAQKLADAGHEDVYCVVLKNSSHIGYCWDDPADAKNYQNTVHAFYKKYGIAGYNEQYAQAGMELLEKSRIIIG